MIIKQKNFKFIIKKFKRYISRFVFLNGMLALMICFITLGYYFSSGLSDRYPFFLLIKKVDKVIFQKYVGFSIYEFDQYFVNKLNVLKYLFIKNELENLQIIIDQKNLYNLEMQRQKRLGKLKNNKIDLDNMSKAQMNFNNQNFDIKLRVKGDRLIHWYNKNETSYKIDLIGENRFKGIEEFSIQKPITRNYIYEYIFHKLLEYQNLISLKYFFVNLKINDSETGVYAIEEGFSKELIERNKKRNGPIFGVDEKISDSPRGVVYPYILYDLYSREYWENNHPQLTENAFIKLNNLKKRNIEVSEIFDLESWAKYFAIIDLTGGWHGVLSKSVKLFFNPVTDKFEPIGFDAHIIPNSENNFILLDFLNEENKNCIGVCYDREWFLTFLKKKDGSLNNEFIKMYIEQINMITKRSYIDGFYKKYNDQINFYNSQFKTENFKKDIGGMYKGFGNYIYDDIFLYKRAEYITKRMNDINEIGNLQIVKKKNFFILDNLERFFFKKIDQNCDNKVKQSYYVINNLRIPFLENCKYFIGNEIIKVEENISISSDIEKIKSKYHDFFEIENLEEEEGIFYLNKNLTIDKDYLISKDKTLIVNKGVQINFKNDHKLISYGSIKFKGTESEPILINNNGKNGSIIFQDNNFLLENMIINNLSSPKDKNRILHGGINFINSLVDIKNVEIRNSKGEDAINLISSETNIFNLKIFDIFSDGIDIDFGRVVFSDISCQNIGNDCFDLSNAIFSGKNLIAKNVNDKGLSVGENSEGKIENLQFEKNKLAIAVKDGSKLNVNNLEFLTNTFDIAVFKKKKEYDIASLYIDNIKDFKNTKIYLGKKNFLKSDQTLQIKKVKNSFLNEIFY